MSLAAHILFTNLNEAEQFKAANALYLDKKSKEIRRLDNVAYTEVWLTKNVPSYIAGFNCDDEIVCEVKLDAKEINALQEQERAFSAEWGRLSREHSDVFDDRCVQPNKELKRHSKTGCEIAAFILQFRAFYEQEI